MHELTCNDCATWLHAYLDNELDTLMAGAMRSHLDLCPTCQARWEELHAISTAVRQLPYHEPLPALRERLLAQLQRQDQAIQPPAPPERTWREALGIGWRWGVPAVSTAVLAVAMLLFLATPSGEEQITDEIVASHVRSLMAGHFTDIASSDRHTVKPWFIGQLDFSPPVQDFAKEGYPLVGGRLDYIAQRPVAALCYRHHKHLINVFVMPTTQPDSDMQTIFKRGYYLISWRRQHLAFDAISDLGRDELDRLSHLIAGQP
jgi:anti-sigma factor RsiW